MDKLFALYKPLRNKLRKLDRRDSLVVIWAYSQRLALSDFVVPAAIHVPRDLTGNPVFPYLWELEILAGEVLLNSGEAANPSKTLRDAGTFADVINDIRHLENEIYGAQENADVHMELWRIGPRQFTWQQKGIRADELIRYYMIFKAEQIDKVAKARLSLSIYDVYLIGMMFLGGFMGNFAFQHPIKSTIPGITPEAIDKWLAFSLSEVGPLREKISENHKIDEQFAYRFSPLRERPIIKTRYKGQDNLICPIPMHIFWRMTGGLYYSLIDDPAFPNALGSSFQAVCGEILRRALPAQSFNLIAEATYGSKKKEKRTPDWVVDDWANSVVMLIECKALRMTWKAKESFVDLGSLKNDLEKLASAVVQVYSRIQEYKNKQWPNLAFDEKKALLPVVVTMEDWYLYGRVSDMLDTLVREAMDAERLPSELLDASPYAVVSINDLERLAQLIAQKGIADIIEGKVLDKDKRTWLWHGYLVDRSNGVKMQKTLFGAEWDRLFEETYEAAKSESET